MFSDVVWTEVVRLLRWSAAGTHGTPSLQAGTWWRLAAGCADLLRRLPGLSAELGEGWTREPEPDADADRTGTERVQRAATRLTGLLHSTGPVPLHRLATGVDQLGAAAISALVEPSWSTLPRTP